MKYDGARLGLPLDMSVLCVFLQRLGSPVIGLFDAKLTLFYLNKNRQDVVKLPNWSCTSIFNNSVSQLRCLNSCNASIQPGTVKHLMFCPTWPSNLKVASASFI